MYHWRFDIRIVTSAAFICIHLESTGSVYCVKAV